MLGQPKFIELFGALRPVFLFLLIGGWVALSVVGINLNGGPGRISNPVSSAVFTFGFSVLASMFTALRYSGRFQRMVVRPESTLSPFRTELAVLSTSAWGLVILFVAWSVGLLL